MEENLLFYENVSTYSSGRFVSKYLESTEP